jgi:hypothetical protein
MKNMLRLFGTIALVAILGFTIAGCGGDDSSSTTTDPKTLEGNITIAPATAEIGTELTATYSGSETVTYQWKRNNTDIAGATSTTYTVTQAGGYTVAVSASGYTTKTSSAVNVVGEVTTGWGPWDQNWQPASEITDGYRRREMLNDATHYEVEFNEVWAFGTPGLAYEPINNNGEIVAYGVNGPATAFRVRKGTLTAGVANTTLVPATSTTPAIPVRSYTTVGLGSKGVYIPAQHRENLPGTTTLGPYLPVTEIGADEETPADYAFMGLDIDSVSLPSYVRLIGENAFQNVTNLEYIITRTYGASASSDLVKIDNNAFNGCTKFEGFIYNVVIDSVGTITSKKTDAYNLPYGLKEIGARAFQGCTSIKLIQIPATINLVGNAAFSGWQVPQKISIYKAGNEQQIAAAWNIQSSNSIWSRDIASGKFANGAQETVGTITYDRATENGYIVVYNLDY